MSGFNPELIAEALDEFHAAEASSPQAPGGLTEVRATVTRRRRVKVTMLSVLGVLLITVPVAAFAAHPRGNNPPPVTSSRTPGPQPRAITRDALFSGHDLAVAGVRVPADSPAWAGCPGQVTSEEPPGKQPFVSVSDAIHTNIDADPDLEAVVVASCRTDRLVEQVVGYGTDAEGRPLLLGTLVKPQEPHHIVDLAIRYEGGFTITVSWYELGGSDSGPEDQKRDFAWDGTVLRQVGGPQAFAEPPRADLAITSGPLVYGKAPRDNLRRRGTVTVTVKNLGPHPSDGLEIELSLSGLTIEGEPGNVAHGGQLQPGESRTYYLEVLVPADTTPTTMRITIRSRVNDTVSGNNYVDVAVMQG